ncbi:MAG: TolB family protein, partial [Cytophagales bacterium]
MIDTDVVRVIFPKGLEGQARRLVNTVQYLDANNRASIGNKKHKINITFQNQTTISNGYVQLAPFKSEFFTNPLQESAALGSIPWLDLLAIHEYRHVMQYSNGLRGLSKFAFFLFGENGWAFANGLSVPNWFFEGDAVLTETALSAQGRGRLPAFQNPYKSLGLVNKVFNYAKVRNGSLKDYVPNHYNTGYLMCVFGREKYGNEFWKNVFRNATSYKYPFYPFSRAIFNETGRKDNAARLYNKTIHYFNEKWKNEFDSLRLTKADLVKTRSKRNTVTNYEFPYFVNDSQIVVLKSSFKQIPYFTTIDSKGKESRLLAQGYTTDQYFDYKNGKICWSELRYNARWSNFNYSVIKVYDLKTQLQSTVTTKTKYFSPSLSQDAAQIVAVQQTENQIYSLHILDVNTGNILMKLPNPENLFYTYPKYSADNQSIVSSVRNAKGQMALINQKIESGEISILVPFSNNILGISYPTNDFVYFEASFSGIDNIFAVQVGKPEVYQITSRAIGNYQPAISTDGKKMIFSQFSNKGNDLYSMDLENANYYLFNIINISQQTKFDFAAMQIEGGSILEKIPNEKFEVQKYKRGSNLLNVHSWSPQFIPPNYGITLLSDNILNNFSISASATYNTNEKAERFSVGASYGGFFPVVNANVFKDNFRMLDFDYEVEEAGANAGLAVPLNFSSGIYQRKLVLSSNYTFSYLNNRRAKTGATYPALASFNANQNPMQSAYFQAVEGQILFVNKRRAALQNIFPKNSQYINLQYKQSVSLPEANQLSLVYELA